MVDDHGNAGGPSTSTRHAEPTHPLFSPFRALGLISEGGTPFVMQRRGRETFVVTSVGTSWQIYNAQSLRLRLIGPDVTRGLPRAPTAGIAPRGGPEDEPHISALAVKGDLTFAAVGAHVVECKRVHRTGVYSVGAGGLGGTSGGLITQLMVLGSLLVGLSPHGVHVWNIGSYGAPEREMLARVGDPTFQPSCMAHPQTYLNKVVVGSSDGRMKLVNIVTGKTIYEFASLGSSVETIVPSPALDVLAVGLLDGRVLLRDVRQDSTLLELSNASGAGAKAESFLSRSLDEMRFRSMESSCSAVAFDGGKLMATGGTAGVISVWNLETQTVHAIIRDAHDGPLSHMEFLAGQPVLVSTADDNSIKEWIFDGTDGQPRLLRFRNGHSAPPTIVRHYSDSTRLLSGGQDRAFRYFSTVQDAQSREMSQGHVTHRAKKLKISDEELKLSRIIALDACDVRERDWSNVITAHENDPVAYVWRIQRFAQGEFALTPPKIEDDELLPVSSVCLSQCGNFGFVGTEKGRIDRYNMQSGLHRGSYTTPEGFSAHCGAVTGLAADACNKNLVSGGLDGSLKFWDLKTRKMRGEMDLGSKIGCIAFHPTTSLVAIACDDGVIRLCDIEAQTIVRRFKGHTDRITDLQFSADCRWLLSSSMDGTLRIWDVPGSTILQVLKMESPITSLSLSPAMDVLVTTHVERRGIYAWANELIFGALESITASNKPIPAKMPVSSSEMKRLTANAENTSLGAGMLMHSAGGRIGRKANSAEGKSPAAVDSDESISISLGLSDLDEDVVGDDAHVELHQANGGDDEVDEADKADEVDAVDEFDDNCLPTRPPAISSRDQQVLSGMMPVAPAMITMSMLPRSQWLGMIHIDSIKTRNKPIEPPKKPEAAPFFLPTATGVNAGRDPVFISEEDQERVRKAAAAAWGDEDDEEAGDEDPTVMREAVGGNSQAEDTAEARAHAGRINGKASAPAFESLNSLLDTYDASKTWRPVLSYLKSISPSKLDVQLRSLDTFEFGQVDHDDTEQDEHPRLRSFMLFLADAIGSSTDFEFLQALLRAFILIHGDAIVRHPGLKDIALSIEQRTNASWGRIRDKLQRTQCIVGILQNNH